MGLCWYAVPAEEDKQVKNGLHLDLALPSSQDRGAEIARPLERGATLVDLGQRDAPWTVRAVPRATSSVCWQHAPVSRAQAA